MAEEKVNVESPAADKSEDIKVYGLFPAKEYKGLKCRIRRANGENVATMKIETKISLHDDCINAVKLLEEKRSSMKAAFSNTSDSSERYNLVKMAESIDSDLDDLKRAITNLTESVESKKSEVIESYDW